MVPVLVLLSLQVTSTWPGSAGAVPEGVVTSAMGDTLAMVRSEAATVTCTPTRASPAEGTVPVTVKMPAFS